MQQQLVYRPPPAVCMRIAIFKQQQEKPFVCTAEKQVQLTGL
jgi:hypothetical protein